MTDRLFGTDGIRGRALEAPLDELTVRRLGAALAMELGVGGCAELLLAGDTRASTVTLAGWLASSYVAAGGRVVWGDVLPTPAVSQLLRSGVYAAGVVISASHNPADDNGIKVLGATGEKLADESERRLEAALPSVEPAIGPDLPPVDAALAERYLELVAGTHSEPRPLDGLRVVVDAAHGAASGLATRLLERLGAEVRAIFSAPNGSNINAGCGATAPEALAATVRELGADCGLALDGDADRAILVDERGEILDGDDLLLAWGRHLAASDSLPGRRLVATVMSNFGLEQALARDGIEVIRCPVGDRSVWLAMRESGAVLGGEQSGHVICAHHAVTGDGLLTGTHLLAIAAARRCHVSELSDLVRLPQVLHNVQVRRRRPFDELPAVCRELAEATTQLDGRGRVLLRYSGTEPVARVMVEGDDAAEIEALASRLIAAIRQELA